MLPWTALWIIAYFLLQVSNAEVSLIIGGETDGVFQGSLATVETYSPPCGLFESNLPPIPKARKLLGAAYLDGFVYICGGYNVILEVKECYKLDLTDPSKGWQAIAPMLKARFNFKMVTAKGRLYAIGGEGPFFEHDDIEVYDPATNTWTQSVALSGFRLGFCAAASPSEEEIFIVGGIDQNGEKKRLESLNLTTMEWKRWPDMFANRSACACASASRGLIVAGGWGNDVGPNVGNIVPVKTTEFFDFQQGSWEEFPSMRHRRTEFVIGVYDEELVTAFGGYQGQHLNSVEEFDGELNWDYLGQTLQDPKSKMAIVTVPNGYISEDCYY